ncbi:MAG: WD40 repeat domain-containing protein [Gaiellales bacterium]
MSSELERRLERALGEAPGPDPGVTDRALRSALEALPSPADVRRARRRRLTLLLAACIAAFVSGGVTLAATGAHLPVVNPEPATTHGPSATVPDGSLLPAGASIWAVADGRATAVTAEVPEGRRHGSHLTAFAASPGSLYLVEGRERGLRAVEARTGRVAWSRDDLGGRPIAATWSPFPIRIAYVLRTSSGYTVGDLWGTGTHRFTVDRDAAPVLPAWRWDSKALAYVSASGAVVVHDVIGGANRSLATACGVREPTAVAFAPAGTLLAVADRAGRIAIVDTSGTQEPRCLTGPAGRPQVAWLGRDQLLAAAGTSLTRYGLAGPEATAHTVSTGRPVVALDVAPGGRGIVVALRGQASTIVEATTPPRMHSTEPALAHGLVLLHLHGPVQVQWR